MTTGYLQLVAGWQLSMGICVLIRRAVSMQDLSTVQLLPTKICTDNSMESNEQGRNKLFARPLRV
jgi:hypothetical protein